MRKKISKDIEITVDGKKTTLSEYLDGAEKKIESIRRVSSDEEKQAFENAVEGIVERVGMTTPSEILEKIKNGDEVEKRKFNARIREEISKETGIPLEELESMLDVEVASEEYKMTSLKAVGEEYADRQARFHLLVLKLLTNLTNALVEGEKQKDPRVSLEFALKQVVSQAHILMALSHKETLVKRILALEDEKGQEVAVEALLDSVKGFADEFAKFKEGKEDEK